MHGAYIIIKLLSKTIKPRRQQYVIISRIPNILTVLLQVKTFVRLYLYIIYYYAKRNKSSSTYLTVSIRVEQL